MSLLDEEPLSFIEMLRCHLADETLYSGRPPLPSNPDVGRPRKNPYWLWSLFNRLVSELRRLRAVERELATPEIWAIIMAEAYRRFPDDVRRHPTAPMSRQEYLHLLSLHAAEDANLHALRAESEAAACRFAIETGQLSGRHGTVKFPGRDDAIHADCVAVRSLYNPTVTDTSGSRPPKRPDPDAADNRTGDDRTIPGYKYLKVLSRGAEPQTRFLLSIEHVPGSDEGKALLEAVERLRPRIPGATTVCYDGALRGTHIDALMTDFGLSALLPMHAASGAKGSGKPRVEKQTPIETAAVTGGSVPTCRVVADGGAAGVLTRNVAGEEVYESMELINVKRIQNKGGTWRWYATYRLPQRHGGGTVFLRLNAEPGDDKRKLKRAENLRLFPPSSPQYKALYGRRSDAESSNRHYKDSLWLDRAHCLGARRHLVTMYGYQQARNAIAIARHRARLLQSPLTA